MAKTFRPWSPRQAFLLPPSPTEWLAEGHLAYFVLEVVEELDVSALFAHYERELRGYPPYHPRMMVALLLYGYAIGVCSSRQLERRTYEDVAFRVLCGGAHPDHTSISEFRRIHLESLSKLFVQVLQLCRKAGLVRLGHVAVDGTKMKANASKHKAMSHGRMKDEEQRLQALVDELMSKAESVDRDEDEKHGVGKAIEDLPEDLRRAQSRLARIRKAKAELEAEAKLAHERSTADEGDGGGTGSDELPSHRVPTLRDGAPTEKAQRNFTDPESRIMKTNDGFLQGYNAQAAVDEHAQIIVAQALTNQPPDVEHLVPMVEQVVDNCGAAPRVLTADSGYYSERNVKRVQSRGTDVFIATERVRHGSQRLSVRGRPPAGLTPKQRMARKVRTKRGSRIYARRKTIVEPVFGQLKMARGLRGFLLRGVAKARGEWALMCVGHNLRKLHRARTTA
jgi:transposase